MLKTEYNAKSKENAEFTKDIKVYIKYQDKDLTEAEKISKAEKPFLDITEKYKKKGYKIPKLTINHNIFNKNPLYLSKNDINYYYLQQAKDKKGVFFTDKKYQFLKNIYTMTHHGIKEFTEKDDKRADKLLEKYLVSNKKNNSRNKTQFSMFMNTLKESREENMSTNFNKTSYASQSKSVFNYSISKEASKINDSSLLESRIKFNKSSKAQKMTQEIEDLKLYNRTMGKIISEYLKQRREKSKGSHSKKLTYKSTKLISKKMKDKFSMTKILRTRKDSIDGNSYNSYERHKLLLNSSKKKVDGENSLTEGEKSNKESNLSAINKCSNNTSNKNNYKKESNNILNSRHQKLLSTKNNNKSVLLSTPKKKMKEFIPNIKSYEWKNNVSGKCNKGKINIKIVRYFKLKSGGSKANDLEVESQVKQTSHSKTNDAFKKLPTLIKINRTTTEENDSISTFENKETNKTIKALNERLSVEFDKVKDTQLESLFKDSIQYKNNEFGKNPKFLNDVKSYLTKYQTKSTLNIDKLLTEKVQQKDFLNYARKITKKVNDKDILNTWKKNYGREGILDRRKEILREMDKNNLFIEHFDKNWVKSMNGMQTYQSYKCKDLDLF